jgi:DNA (cytosine-5)-methyltransferase 1
MNQIDFKGLRESNILSMEEASDLLGVSVKTLYRWESGETEPQRSAVILLQDRLNYRKKAYQKDPDFTFIDLFAGIGGIRRGFESVGGKCIFTSEWDKYANQTYRANFPDEHEIVGDITKIGLDDIPVHDVLLAGFPCQPFSIAGVSKKNSLGRAHGFMDETQGTLFFDVLRILKHHRPAAFVLENVKNLVSHDKGRTFKTIIGALEDELGYSVSWKVINAKGYVPQNRQRIFIVGFREDVGFDLGKLEFANPDTGPVLEDILHHEGESPEGHFTLAPETMGANLHCLINQKYTLTDKLWSYLQGYAEKHRKAGNGFGFGLNGPADKARTLSARYYKDGSEILIRQDTGNPRRLTPRECARLMGFDRKGQPPFIMPVSDTQAYRQFGNSVVVPVVEAVARAMKPSLMQALHADTMPRIEAAE